MNATVFTRSATRTALLCTLALWSLNHAATIEVPSRSILTISDAMIKARAGDTILVNNGTYNEHVFIKSGTTLKARNTFKARIDGNGRGTVVTMAKNCGIIGMEVRNGTIGIFSAGADNHIEKCRVINHWQTGIVVVRHLPRIEDNVIVFNQASGIQGWDVRATVGSINHNTIAFNRNHGIAMGGNCNVIIENNVVAFNERFGLKISDQSKTSAIWKNNFFSNLNNTAPDGNFSFDPAFIAPRTTFNFQSDPKVCCKIKGSDNINLGARLYDD